jgi:hypothetical protein
MGLQVHKHLVVVFRHAILKINGPFVNKKRLRVLEGTFYKTSNFELLLLRGIEQFRLIDGGGLFTVF